MCTVRFAAMRSASKSGNHIAYISIINYLNEIYLRKEEGKIYEAYNIMFYTVERMYFQSSKIKICIKFLYNICI